MRRIRKIKKRKVNLVRIIIAIFWVLLVATLVTSSILFDPNKQYNGGFFNDVAKNMEW